MAQNYGLPMAQLQGRALKDINPDRLVLHPVHCIFTGTGYLYFAADDGINGSELWQSDGSDANTTLLSDINPAQVIQYRQALFTFDQICTFQPIMLL
ncbi:MAG: hypothetical protein H6656_22650 [Ardenticatenaceae bacterium]|nr:hypothetical protein [Ardenticatenaceae bacterium]